MPDREKVTFPLTLDQDFNREIDEAVYQTRKTKKISKQQFCQEAVREKIDEINGRR